MASVTVLEGLEVPVDKHELILSGPEVTKTVKEKGFKDELWNLHNLNYLRISAELVELPSKMCGLTNLTCLVLHLNKLQTLPAEISKLSKLKILDVSRNSLATIPDELSKLSQLSTLNLSSNNLTGIPSLRENVKLSSINLSCNKFEKFPDCCYQELSMLSDINLSSNEITYISGDINKLQTLKVLDLADNKILEIPAELSLLTKLKELNLKGNKLKDRRLMKMVDQCHSKKVIDFIKHHYGKQVGSHAVRRESLRSSLSEDKENTIEEAKEKPKYVIQVSKPVLKGLEVSVATTVKPVRPGIACCVIRNVSFTEETLKDFIQIQNKFHDTICNKRERATIGTHDLDLIMSPLKYTALESKDISFVPLGESNPCTAEQFIADKREEAEKLKKEKKRNWLAGVYKYIKMVEGFSNYACLIDANNTVISFPPITNSEVSKIRLGTKNIMVEVTSGTEKKVAREVLDKFLKELVKMKISKLSEDQDDNDSCNILELEQVTFIPEKGPKLHYPNEGDLQLSSGDIVRRNLF